MFDFVIIVLVFYSQLWQWDTTGKALQPVYMKGLSTNKGTEKGLKGLSIMQYLHQIVFSI